MSWLRGDYVVLHPDDVTVLRSEAGEVLGYRLARPPRCLSTRDLATLVESAHPAPGSIPKPDQTVDQVVQISARLNRHERTQ